MNSSVTAGRIVHTTSSVWLPCENFTGCGFERPSYFQANQNSATSVTTKMMPVSQRMNMNNWSITRPCSEMSFGNQMLYIGAATNVATPKIGTNKNRIAQKRFTTNSEISSLLARTDRRI